MVTTDYAAGPIQTVEGRRKAWRRNFSGTSLNSEYWTVNKAPGMTVAVAAGVLTVNMNTAIDEETTITSVEGFTLPFRVQFTHGIAQRIANNEVYLEVVNAAGTTYTGWMFDGAVTTSGKTVHANQGASTPASPTGTTTVATSGSAVIREIDCRLDSIDFIDRTVDSSTQATSRVVKTRTTLDPEEKYYIRMRFKNLGTAPASNTINTFDTIIVQDTNDILVEIGAGRGNNTGSRTVPVYVNNTITSIIGSSATLGTALAVTRFIGVTNAAQTIKATVGKLFGLLVVNPGAAAVYVNVYNVVSPVIGTTQPNLQILVPPGQSFSVDLALGIAFSTAMTVAATDISIPLSAVAPATVVTVNAFWL